MKPHQLGQRVSPARCGDASPPCLAATPEPRLPAQEAEPQACCHPCQPELAVAEKLTVSRKTWLDPLAGLGWLHFAGLPGLWLALLAVGLGPTSTKTAGRRDREEACLHSKRRQHLGLADNSDDTLPKGKTTVVTFFLNGLLFMYIQTVQIEVQFYPKYNYSISLKSKIIFSSQCPPWPLKNDF